MSRFIESIKLKDGVFYRLKFHQARIDRAFEECMPGEEPFSLFEELNQYLIPQEGVFKCRILYNEEVESLEFQPYTMRNIRSLKLVDVTVPTLSYKSSDRIGINAAFDQRGECDDIIMVRDGLLTDTSYANIALFDGNEWFTPKTPLLYGTNRAELLLLGKITEKDIPVSDLPNYQKIALFNALIEFGELVLAISDKVISYK
jgi:Branched-chain amino acid aminotransferase/4-amino-4-deoxychorismate lyase